MIYEAEFESKIPRVRTIHNVGKREITIQVLRGKKKKISGCQNKLNKT